MTSTTTEAKCYWVIHHTRYHPNDERDDYVFKQVRNLDEFIQYIDENIQAGIKGECEEEETEEDLIKQIRDKKTFIAYDFDDSYDEFTFVEKLPFRIEDIEIRIELLS